MTRSPPSRSVRHRALTRAARAWRDGYPHRAWEILTDAGCGYLWRPFLAEQLRRAREQAQAALLL